MIDLSSPLGAAFANHLWQSTLFVGAAWLLSLLLRAYSARLRYAIWLTASVKFLVPFSLLIALGGLLPKPHSVVEAQRAAFSTMDTVGQPFSETVLSTPRAVYVGRQAHAPGTFLPLLLVAVWLFGVMVVLTVWWMRWRQVSAAIRLSVPNDVGCEATILRRLEGLRRVELRLSENPVEPAIFGIFRPKLIWPARLSERLDDQHIEAIVAHELAHVRRLYVRIIAKRRVMMSSIYRSMFNDLGGGPKRVFAFACLLTVFLPAAPQQTSTASAADQQSAPAMKSAAPFIFSIVSIREARPTSIQSVSIDNPTNAGLFVGRNIKVSYLISAAYGIDGHYISDKSSWDDSVLFDVSAKSDASVNDALAKLSEDDAKLEKQHMLQALLSDRFKFSAHKESRVTSVYELRLAKGGPKFQEAGVESPHSTELEACHYIGRCGRQSCGPNGCDLTALSYSMKYLCSVLQGQIYLPVVDRTGLTGNYIFRLEYHGDIERESETVSTPSVFTAVQDQLGLKLVKTQSQVEYIVVDHIEKPTPN